MTRQQATGMDLEYVFNDPNDPDPLNRVNDGRIIARINRLNTVNPETVKYKYDQLNRLIEAEQTTGPPPPQGQPAGSNWWGMTWDLDGFGNRWTQAQKSGRVGIPSTVSFDQTTNRVNSSGYGYDGNGNMTSMVGANGALVYDIDNRLTKVDKNGSYEEYRYLADNKRYWKRTNQGGTVGEEYYLYGVGGQRIATYSASTSGVLTLNAGTKKLDVYFAGKAIWQNGKAIVQDRLGSVMARANGSGGVDSHDYYPYGEERPETVGDRNKFGTYHRDQTGLDYADQRYYNSAIGRFMSSDPYEASGGAARPVSWGRFPYVAGDPMNKFDRRGLAEDEPDPGQGSYCQENPDYVECRYWTKRFEENPSGTPPAGTQVGGGATLSAAAQSSQSMKKKLKSAVDTILAEGSDCEKYLTKQFGTGGGSVAGIKANVDSVNLYNILLENQSGKDRTIGDVLPGAENAGMFLSNWLYGIQGGPPGLLHGAQVQRTQSGKVTTTIFVGDENGFTDADYVHEMLHVYTGLADGALGAALGLTDGSTGKPLGQSASFYISEFLKSGCSKTKF